MKRFMMGLEIKTMEIFELESILIARLKQQQRTYEEKKTQHVRQETKELNAQTQVRTEQHI